MEKKSETHEQNFTEGKAIHYLCSGMQCVKLSFMIKNFEKWREVMVLKFFNLVLKRYWKSMENNFFKRCGNPVPQSCYIAIFQQPSNHDPL